MIFPPIHWMVPAGGARFSSSSSSAAAPLRNYKISIEFLMYSWGLYTNKHKWGVARRVYIYTFITTYIIIVLRLICAVLCSYIALPVVFYRYLCGWWIRVRYRHTPVLWHVSMQSDILCVCADVWKQQVLSSLLLVEAQLQPWLYWNSRSVNG